MILWDSWEVCPHQETVNNSFIIFTILFSELNSAGLFLFWGEAMYITEMSMWESAEIARYYANNPHTLLCCFNFDIQLLQHIQIFNSYFSAQPHWNMHPIHEFYFVGIAFFTITFTFLITKTPYFKNTNINFLYYRYQKQLFYEPSENAFLHQMSPSN